MSLPAVPPSVLRIYHKNRKQFLSVLRAATHITSQYELVPDIVEVFEEDAVKFLEIFGGRVISVPPFNEVVTQMRRVAIWLALKPLPEEQRVEAASRMVASFGMHRKRILETFDSMDVLLDSLGIELREDRGAENNKEKN